MGRVTLRFYAELNDHLPPGRRGRDWVRELPNPAPARHLIEACGVPHTEVELLLCDGVSVGLEQRVEDGARLAVYPLFEAFDLGPLRRLQARALRQPCFLADAHLGALARALRLLGFDTLWANDWGDAELARRAGAQRRILLTRDRALLMRRAVTHGLLVPSGPTAAQLAWLVDRLQLCGALAPFTRCLRCNTPLTALAPEVARARLPAGFRCAEAAFWTCGDCGRLYWRGSHWRAMCRRIAAVCPGWRDGVEGESAAAEWQQRDRDPCADET